ncbi:MAG: hypothetical protein WC022_03795 [Parcubacteria group bacterium]
MKLRISIIVCVLFFWVSGVSAKSVVTPSDFTFLGGFRTPSSTPYLQGLTYRYKNGGLVLYSVMSGTGATRGNLVEMRVPTTLTANSPFAYTVLNYNYGDIYQDKLVDLMPNGGVNPPAIGISGGATPPNPFWDELDQRMYWTKVISYDNGISDICATDAGIGYSTLDDTVHTGTGIGEWRLDTKLACGGHGTRYAFNMLKVPDGFSQQYFSGVTKYALGFGGGVSVVSNGPPSNGPALSILDHAPNLAQESNQGYMSSPPTMLLSHFYGQSRADMPAGIYDLNYRGDPGYFGLSNKWNTSDESYYGVWVEGQNKQGVMAFALTGGGNTATTVASETSKSVFTVADIGDIRAGDVLQVASDGATDPAHYPFEMPTVLSVNGDEITLKTAMVGNPIIGGNVICGVWYRGGGAEVSRMWTPYYIYNEDDIGAVYQGAKSADGLPFSSAGNWAFPGVTYPLPGGAYGATTTFPHVVRGATFDSTTNRLYVMAYNSSGINDVYVYQLNDSVPSTYTIGGTLSGLSGTLVLQNNGGNNLTQSSDGSFTFSVPLQSAAAYNVTVSTQPNNQNCTVANGAGTVASSNISNISVTCVAGADTTSPSITSFTIPSASDSLSVGSINLVATDNTGVTSYCLSETDDAAACSWSPTAPTNHIFSSDGSHTLYAFVKDAANNVSVSANDSVTITLPTYTIGGTVSGLTGTLVLQNNNGNNLSLSSNGAFNFSSALQNAYAYNVTVFSQPAGQTCTISNGAGTVVNTNVTNVAVSCVNGADSILPTIDSFIIPTTATSLLVPVTTFMASDNVAVINYCLSETNTASDCIWSSSVPTSYVFSSEGTHSLYAFVKDAANNISASYSSSVTVTLPTYIVGGTVSGLTGTVILQNNSGDNLSLTSDGPFVFSTALHAISPYAITVLTQPNNQICSVSGGSGTVFTSDVTNVAVNCVTLPPILSHGAPSGELDKNTTQITLSLTTNENATCKYATVANTSYAVMPNTFSTTGSTTHSALVINLKDSNSYDYYVRCDDGSGNVDMVDYHIGFDIKSKTVLGAIKLKINKATIKFKNTIYAWKKKLDFKGSNDSLTNGTVKIYKGNSLWKTIQVGADGTWNKLINIKNGFSDWLRIKRYDESGNLISTNKAKLKVDTQKPTFNQPFPLALTKGRADRITFDATDSNLSYYKVELLDSQGHVKNSWREQDEYYYFIPADIPNGKYIMLVRAYDKAGNYAEEQTQLTVVWRK